MPNKPKNIIQNRAPGPPTVMATATPAMLPSPTVADSAEVSALNGEMSPSPDGSWYLPRTTSMACFMPRRLMKPW